MDSDPEGIDTRIRPNVRGLPGESKSLDPLCDLTTFLHLIEKLESKDHYRAQCNGAPCQDNAKTEGVSLSHVSEGRGEKAAAEQEGGRRSHGCCEAAEAGLNDS